MCRIETHGSYWLFQLTRAFIILSFFVLNAILWRHPMESQQYLFLEIFSFLSVVTILVSTLSFQTRFLLSTFFMLITWRLASLAQLPWMSHLYLIILIFKTLNFAVAAYNDIQAAALSDNKHHHNTRFEWQLFFIRMFIGFDLVPHFCEKLFAGNAIRMGDVHAFAQLGVHNPLMTVLVAGLCELGGALSISTGLFTRLGSFCLFIYLMVATILGHHFSLGFIWAAPGGGWEFPVMWGVLIFSFTLFGAGEFSVDYALINRYPHCPRFIYRLMGQKTLI